MWGSIVVAITAAAAALQANYAVGEMVSYKTCNPGRSYGPWDYAYHPTLWPTVITAFLTLAAMALAWSRKRDGLVVNGFRFFFFLISLVYLYLLMDQTRLYDYDHLLLVSCDGENWKDMEEIVGLATIMLALPILIVATILTVGAEMISSRLR